MPELPEVETIRLGLQKELIGHKIQAADVRVAKLFDGDSQKIVGQKVLEIERRAKILIWRLENCYLLIHLKMTGQLIFVPKKSEEWFIGGHPDKVYTADLPHKHTHVIIEFDNGTLYFNDLRKFGWIRLLDTVDQVKPHIANLGPEYDWPEFTSAYFQQKLASRAKSTIKQALLDQTILAGLGNIYADETLFCAKVHPRRTISSLSAKEMELIYKCIPKILKSSLEHGGTSSQSYRKHDGTKGTFLEIANVYKREGQPCKVCKTPIERIKITGRSSHFCPKCQS